MKGLKQQLLTKRFMIGILISSLILITGCPYQAKFPISKPKMAIDPGLLGKWKKTKGKTKNYWHIKKKNAKQYTIIDYTWNKSKKKYTKKTYKAHFTKIKSWRFLNIEHRKGSYIYYRMTGVRSRYNGDPITGNIRTKIRNAGQLKSFIEKNGHLGFFYEKVVKFYKY